MKLRFLWFGLTALLLVPAGWAAAGPVQRESSLRVPTPPAKRLAVLASRINRDITELLARHANEPQTEALWATVRGEVSDRLLALFRSGELVGTKPEQAYFVRCDRTTMTTADIEGGVLKVVVGYAPVKPAEFEVLAFQQAVRKR